MLKNKREKSMKNKSKKNKSKKIYNKVDYLSGDGMLTNVWGPTLWHYLHVISFNYPNNPTKLQKKKYKQLLLNFQYTLPCKYCRINLKNNFKTFPLKDEHFENRDKFSRYIYNLHEIINKMLGKKSNIKYCDLRDKYEHFRSRCTIQNKDDLKNHNKIFKYNSSKFKNTVKQMTDKSTTDKPTKESGCTTPLYGKKSKCVINIVPQEKKCKTFKIDKKCLKQKLSFK